MDFFELARIHRALLDQQQDVSRDVESSNGQSDPSQGKKSFGDDLSALICWLATYKYVVDPPEERDEVAATDKSITRMVKPGFPRIARHLGIDADDKGRKLKTRITKAESFFNASILWMQPGKSKLEVRDSYERSPGAVQLAAQVEVLVADLLRIRGLSNVPVIRIGCGRALAPWLVPDVVKRYRAKRLDKYRKLGEPLRPFEVEIRVGLPQDLRRDGQRGLYDLVITSFTPLSNDDPNAEHVTSEVVPMHLIASKGRAAEFSVARKPEDIVAGKVLVTTGGSRSPRLRAPQALTSVAQMVWEYDEWMEALSVVDAGHNVVCCAYPQIFPPEKRTQYATFQLEGAKYEQMRLGVLRPEESRQRTGRHQEIVNDLFVEFGERIGRIANENRTSNMTALTEPSYLTTHVSQVNSGEYVWVRGVLDDCSVAPSGAVSAVHRFTPPRKSPQTYEIQGAVTTKEGVTQLSWHGISSHLSTAASNDTYAFSGTTENDVIEKMIGTWTGRATWKDGGEPDLGYFVVHKQELNADDLRTLVETLGGQAEGLKCPEPIEGTHTHGDTQQMSRVDAGTPGLPPSSSPTRKPASKVRQEKSAHAAAKKRS